MSDMLSPLQGEVGGIQQAPFHVVPDPVQGGWNVYDTSRPQEPQQHFASKEAAILYAQEASARMGVGYSVELHEAPSMGR